MRCPKNCRTQHQDILFMLRNRRIQPINNQDKRQYKIGEELDLMNIENLPKYI